MTCARFHSASTIWPASGPAHPRNASAQPCQFSLMNGHAVSMNQSPIAGSTLDSAFSRATRSSTSSSTRPLTALTRPCQISGPFSLKKLTSADLMSGQISLNFSTSPSTPSSRNAVASSPNTGPTASAMPVRPGITLSSMNPARPISAVRLNVSMRVPRLSFRVSPRSVAAPAVSPSAVSPDASAARNSGICAVDRSSSGVPNSAIAASPCLAGSVMPSRPATI